METVNSLLDQPFALLIVLILGAVIGNAVQRAAAKASRGRQRAYWQGRNHGKNSAGKRPGRPTPDAVQTRPVDLAADQLRAVMSAKFTARPLLNKPEAAVFAALDKAVLARNPGWQVMAQVSLGEFLATPDSDAFLAVNSKRVDFALNG